MAQHRPEKEQDQRCQGARAHGTECGAQSKGEVLVAFVDAIQQGGCHDHEGQGQRDLQKRGIEEDVAHGARSYIRMPPSTESVCPVM